jgi:hypothetical protein
MVWNRKEHVAPAPGGSSGAVATWPKVRPLNSKKANKIGDSPNKTSAILGRNYIKKGSKKGLTKKLFLIIILNRTKAVRRIGNIMPFDRHIGNTKLVPC